MKKIFALLALAATLSLSCSKQDAAEDAPYDPDLIRICGGIEVSMTSTKAAITNGVLPTTRAMYVASYNRAAGANHFPCTKFSYNSGSWSADKSWPLSGSLDFLAYSPGASSVTSVSWGSPNATASVTMTMPDNSSLQEDLLVGGVAERPANSSVSIEFKHAEAYLTFTAKAAESYNATTNRGVTINSITLKSAYHSGTVQATRSGSAISFSWSSLASQKTLAAPGISATNLTTTPATLGSGILLPSQTEVGFVINYTLHNGKDSSGNSVNTTLTYDWTPASAITWDPGKKYTYSLDITLVGITVTPTVSSWTTGTNKEIKL